MQLTKLAINFSFKNESIAVLKMWTYKPRIRKIVIH